MPVYKRNNAVFVKNGMPVVAPVGCTCCGKPYCCKIGVNECGDEIYECQTRPEKGECVRGPYDTIEECRPDCQTPPCRAYCFDIGELPCGNKIRQCAMSSTGLGAVSGPYDSPEECGGACVTVPCPPEPCTAECIDVTYMAGVGGYVGHCQQTVLPGSVRTIPIPSGCNYVTITGGVDDELLIDGVIIQPGMFPFNGLCNGAHAVDWSFAKTGSFVLACADNHGQQSGYTLRICFSNLSAASPEDLIPSNPLP